MPSTTETIYWPTDQSFRWEKTKWGPSPGGYWYASATYAASEHGGTHLDSPIHFGEGQATIDADPADAADRPGRRDRHHPRLRARPRLPAPTADDLDAWESAHGRDPRRGDRPGPHRLGPVLARQDALPGQRRPRRHGPPALPWHLARGGRVARRPTQGRRRRASTPPASTTGRRATSSPTASSTAPGSTASRTSRTSTVSPRSGATLIALPMKIKGGSGGPVRVIAILPKSLVSFVSLC